MLIARTRAKSRKISRFYISALRRKTTDFLKRLLRRLDVIQPRTLVMYTPPVASVCQGRVATIQRECEHIEGCKGRTGSGEECDQGPRCWYERGATSRKKLGRASKGLKQDNYPPSRPLSVAIEACGGAAFTGRELGWRCLLTQISNHAGFTRRLPFELCVSTSLYPCSACFSEEMFSIRF